MCLQISKRRDGISTTGKEIFDGFANAIIPYFRFGPSVSEAAGATEKFLRLAAKLLKSPLKICIFCHTATATREVPRTRPVGWISPPFGPMGRTGLPERICSERTRA